MLRSSSNRQTEWRVLHSYNPQMHPTPAVFSDSNGFCSADVRRIRHLLSQHSPFSIRVFLSKTTRAAAVLGAGYWTKRDYPLTSTNSTSTAIPAPPIPTPRNWIGAITGIRLAISASRRWRRMTARYRCIRAIEAVSFSTASRHGNLTAPTFGLARGCTACCAASSSLSPNF